MSKLLKFRVVTVMSLLIVLAASSAPPPKNVIVSDAEPTELHPADYLEMNLWKGHKNCTKTLPPASERTDTVRSDIRSTTGTDEPSHKTSTKEQTVATIEAL